MVRVGVCLSISVVFFSSCTKNVPAPQSTPPPRDSLATGWTKISLSDSSDLEDIFFINSTGFAAGLGPSIFKSTDGGNHWLAIPKPITGNPSNEIGNVSMGNENNAIFVLGLNTLLSTPNAGGTFYWSTYSNEPFYTTFFVDSTTAYTVGHSTYKTVGSDYNWTTVSSNPLQLHALSNYWSLFFLDEQRGWIVRAMDSLYQTTDGGINWQPVPTNFDISKPGSVFFLNADTGYVSSGHNVEKTTDGGNTWTKSFSGTVSYHDIQFVSDKTGYITDSTQIFKTQDGGSTWTLEVSLVSAQLTALHFTDAAHGWACGQKGTILKFSL